MAKSSPFELIMYWFAPVWEYNERYKGSRYRSEGRDKAEAKAFLEMNPGFMDEEESVVEFQEYATRFIDDDFEGWTTQGHPAWAFLRNYKRYAPKERAKKAGDPRPIIILCPDCLAKDRRTVHPATDLCPVCEKDQKEDKP